ncbi:MAG: threonine--tRNA ligase [Nanoarchaeota archaeon]|nr:threonine--tRNA ligase [Nanoarchaeota archaeon]
MIKITFPDGTVKEHEKGATALEIIKQDIGEGLARAALAAKLDDELIDLNTPIGSSGKLTVLTFKDEEGKEVFRHSASHLFAQALLRVFPKAKMAIGPAVDNGFYYDFELDKSITPDDLPKIEAEMKKIVDEKLDIVRKEVPVSEALKIFADNKFKTEMIKELDQDTIRVYKQGDFQDFCRGPHLPNTSYIKAFKLTKVSGAYWKGDSSKEQLQRVYGIAFPDKKDLKAYLTLIEEAERRDHRKIGKVMELYSFHDEAPGMPFFHDKGTFIWNTLHNYVIEQMKKRNYEVNKTPMILNKALWLQSGHWDHYKENMYFTKIDNQDYAVKPMNCPGNILVYKTNTHSYRELPIKAGEFGLVHRHELSGVLSGLFRVRAFTQDDAHVFCTEEQIEDQIEELINFIDEVYTIFGFDYHIELSTKPEKAMGDPKLWELAENKLKNVLEKNGKPFKVNEGDGAFYGPKIDFHLTDAIGRTWQCGTIQLDFQMPEKFDLSYEGQDGRKHRPVMLHRVILGSMERFIGILVEHFAGKFPLWIAPVQAKIVTVSDAFNDYADSVAVQMKDAGIRVEVDKRAESISKKVRDAQVEKASMILTVGEKEQTNNTLAVRTLDGKVKFGVKLDEFIAKVKDNVKKKSKTIEF